VILRDSVTLLVLLFSAVIIYVITSLLFRSFSIRRAQLGREFATEGQQALRGGNAEQAVKDLRLSLSYAPDDVASRYLLAESLAQAHHTDEARSYFMGLLDAQPADGFLNLQLARLERQRKDSQQAIEFYRAATTGNWTGTYSGARFRVQLELADYLVELGELPGARADLLVAEADAPDDPAVISMLAERFEQVQDPMDALNAYRKAVSLDPHDAAALVAAGRLAYQLSDYPEAAKLLTTARREGTLARGEQDEVSHLMASARRIQELTLSADLDPQDRADHILRVLPIAHARLESCTTQVNGTPPATELGSLAATWKSSATAVQRDALAGNATQQEALTNWIYSTEETTARVCGPPTGDDALLLQLANAAQGGREQ
jgi:predicted Zn-dependent protease